MLQYCRGLPFAALLFLVACAPELPPEDPLPLPPPPPPRLSAGRQNAQAARTAAEPEPTGEAAAGEPGEQAGAATAAVTEPGPATASAVLPWRVSRDGVIGCVDPASLRVLRQGADATPRLLAEARTAGGCRTTFRVNAWDVLAQDGDLVRMRLTNGPAMTLWFARADVVAP